MTTALIGYGCDSKSMALRDPMFRQEKRQAFDIHAYGQSVLTTVVSALPPSDRARAQKAAKGEAAKKVTFPFW